MEGSTEENDDLKLIKASATLLSTLESALPKILWKPSKIDHSHGSVHTRVKPRDLNFVVNLIEPFQGEPQLLDAKLKNILPPLIEAYLQYLQLLQPGSLPAGHISLQSAVCKLLYTLCKVRGYKVVVGFFNNEPRYFESILSALERSLQLQVSGEAEWEVPYILLLWLSHLLLAPFDLATISTQDRRIAVVKDLKLTPPLPPLAARVLGIGLGQLVAPTKVQDAAAAMLLRLVTRPDMQELKLADKLVGSTLQSLEQREVDTPTDIYGQIGPFRFLARVASSGDLSYLVPKIFITCDKLATDGESTAVTSNAVARKLLIKLFRNVAISTLRSSSASGLLLNFLQSTTVLEDTIEYLLRSSGDRDTPVRNAAAKALSMAILELDTSMSLEVVQAVLDAFKEDMPRGAAVLDFRTVNSLKWHGLTLTLGHILFKRSASPQQLPDILTALISALNFEQRTATGSSIGTNVRDAANFGIWSIARRYTTKELQEVSTETLVGVVKHNDSPSIIQALAVQLMLAACFDPAGNIRRGSSAALQELIGRHPDEVTCGIDLVQTIDYQAVGLRQRAMVDVASKAVGLNPAYWKPMVDGLFGWRGLGSPDVPSRQAAATAITRLSVFGNGEQQPALVSGLIKHLTSKPSPDIESSHGLTLTLSRMLDDVLEACDRGVASTHVEVGQSVKQLFADFDQLVITSVKVDGRTIISELPAAAARLVSAMCRFGNKMPQTILGSDAESLVSLDTVTDSLMMRYEDSVLDALPHMALNQMRLKRTMSAPLSCLGQQCLVTHVAVDSTKSTMHGAGRALVLGTLAGHYFDESPGDQALLAIKTLAPMLHAVNVDWRVIGLRSLTCAIDFRPQNTNLSDETMEIVATAAHKGLNDYTIDERGDVGSLVRLEALTCASNVLAAAEAGRGLRLDQKVFEDLLGDFIRLSLEKLDRVRHRAAQCRQRFMDTETDVTYADVASVSSYKYFERAAASIASVSPEWKARASLQGCMSCAGVSAEPLVQASRAAIASVLADNPTITSTILALYSSIMKSMIDESSNMTSALELLAFLLDLPTVRQVETSDTFKWRNLLSTVQKSHYKSNDIPRIMAAIRVYLGLANIESTRPDVLKKLIGMLKTNPYPRVRSTVAEVLYVVTNEQSLKDRDWTKPTSQNISIIAKLQQIYVTT